MGDHVLEIELASANATPERPCRVLSICPEPMTLSRESYPARLGSPPKPLGAIEGLDIACICMYCAAMKLLSLPCYCATLRQAARAVTVLYENMLADSGLHATQYTALQLLDLVTNLTTTELAEALGIDQTTATRTLALIKKAGLAIDTVGADRRQRRWALTGQGQALLKKLKPRWEAAQEAFEKRLGPTEAAALKKASHRAADRLYSG